MKTIPHIPTNQTLLDSIPASCPRCNSYAVSWSPKRVWCTMCSFQTATQKNERYFHAIARWNLAVRDGIGYEKLMRENIEREAREAREKNAIFRMQLPEVEPETI